MAPEGGPSTWEARRGPRPGAHTARASPSPPSSAPAVSSVRFPRRLWRGTLRAPAETLTAGSAQSLALRL